MALTVLAAYDVRVDSVRARMAAVLQAYGDRIQKSVFVLHVDESDLELIRAKCNDMLDLDVDSLLLLRMCGNCWTQKIQIGQANIAAPVLYWAVL